MTASRTVLVIDDDNLLRKSLAQALTEAGYAVHEAQDGQAGLQVALTKHPNIIVTDVKMPELDGLQMVEKLRTDEWGKTAPVIILSTDETTASVNEALVANVTTYLPKSTASPDDIISQIKQMLS